MGVMWRDAARRGAMRRDAARCRAMWCDIPFTLSKSLTTMRAECESGRGAGARGAHRGVPARPEGLEQRCGGRGERGLRAAAAERGEVWNPGQGTEHVSAT